MIRVRVSLLPYGDQSKERELGVLDIENDLSGDREFGNYRYRLSASGAATAFTGAIQRFARARGFWSLVFAVLHDAQHQGASWLRTIFHRPVSYYDGTKCTAHDPPGLWEWVIETDDGGQIGACWTCGRVRVVRGQHREIIEPSYALTKALELIAGRQLSVTSIAAESSTESAATP